MNKSLISTALFVAILTIVGCAGSNERDSSAVAVSIEPQKWIVDNLTDSSVAVVALIRSSDDPESFDPSASTLKALHDSEAYFMLGTLPVENRLCESFSGTIFNGSDSLKLLYGTHNGAEGELPDPHIWLSPSNMRTMAESAAARLNTLGMETPGLQATLAQIDSLDREYRQLNGIIESFGAVHPMLGYLACDYGLNQVSVMADGHEMTVREMTAMRENIVASGVRVIFVADASEKSIARSIVEGLDEVQIVEIRPTQYDWLSTMNDILNALKQK